VSAWNGITPPGHGLGEPEVFIFPSIHKTERGENIEFTPISYFYIELTNISDKRVAETTDNISAAIEMFLK